MIQMNLSRCKTRTLVDIYFLYPFKKNIPHKLNTTPWPFIKREDCTDSNLSVDYKEWREVILLYIEKLKDYLEEGNTIELGTRLGEFHLTKYKADRFIDFKKSKEAGKVISFAKNNADNYFIGKSWSRRNIPLKLKSFWKIELNRKWVRNMYKKIEKDYTKIYKIRDSK